MRSHVSPVPLGPFVDPVDPFCGMNGLVCRLLIGDSFRLRGGCSFWVCVFFCRSFRRIVVIDCVVRADRFGLIGLIFGILGGFVLNVEKW